MTELSVPNAIVNNTPADAVPIDSNYRAIEQYINVNTINRDGSIKMTGQLTLVGDPISDNHAARKAYVDALLPIGVMLPWVGLAAPAGQWALANGATLQNSEYPKLYNVIGTRFGTGGAGTFKLPNMAGAVPVGQADATGYLGYQTLGNYGGSTKVPVPSHVHKMDHNHPSSATSDETTNHVHSITHNHGSVNTGAKGAHSHTGSYQQNGEVTGSSVRVVGYVSTGSHATLTDTEPDHVHTVDLPQFVGDSAIPKTKHKHNYDTPNFVGNTAAYSLEVADPDSRKSTTDFYAPFVVIQYIVRLA